MLSSIGDICLFAEARRECAHQCKLQSLSRITVPRELIYSMNSSLTMLCHHALCLAIIVSMFLVELRQLIVYFHQHADEANELSLHAIRAEFVQFRMYLDSSWTKLWKSLRFLNDNFPELIPAIDVCGVFWVSPLCATCTAC